MTFGVTLNFDRKLLRKEKAFFKIAIFNANFKIAQNQLTLMLNGVLLCIKVINSHI